MAKEYTRFVGPQSTKKGDPRSTGTDLIPVDPTPDPAPCPQPAMTTPTLMTRQQLIDMHGEVIGEALWVSVNAERQKAAEKFRVAHARLAEIRAQVAAKQAQAEPRLQELRRSMDEAYQTYMAVGVQIERSRASLQGELASLNGEAEEIVRTLNVPLHAGRVRQWAPVADTREPLGSGSPGPRNPW